MTLLGLRTSYSLKQVAILAFLVVDLSLNTVIDSQSEKVGVLSMMGAQGVVRIMSLFIMLLFMWNTFVFKYGLLGALCKRFKLLFVMFPLSFVFLVAVRIYRGTQLFDNHDVIEIWSNNDYHGVYVVHNLLSIAYYVSLLQSTFDLGNPAFYKASHWLERGVA